MTTIDSINLDRLSLKPKDDFSHMYELVNNDINLIHYCFIHEIPSVIPYLKNLDVKYLFVALFNFDESEMFEYIRKRIDNSVNLCEMMPLIDEYIEVMFE